MLLKLFFILGLSLAGWTATGNNEVTKSQYEKLIREREALLKSAKESWDSCRSQCRSTYTKAGRPYTDFECDIEYCSEKKAKYLEMDRKLKEAKAAQKKLNDEKNKSIGNDPLSQVKKQKKDTGLYAVMGVGTTVFLGYKAKTCCAQCTGSNPSCCGMCPVWVGMTGLAGAQTIKMFDKKDQLGQTVRDLCTQPGGCDDDDDNDDNNGNPPDFQPPGCVADPQKCKLVTHILNNKECPPDDPNCDETKKRLTPDLPGGGNPSGFGEFTGNENHRDKGPGNLFPELARALDWSEGTPNPFDDPTNPFSYDDLPPRKKKLVDNMMADINKQNKDYMDKMGLGADTDKEDDISEAGAGAGTGSGALKDAVSANFPVKADDGSRSLAGNDNQKRGKRKKADSIADQMRAMLAKMNGLGGSEGKNGAGHLGDKSVLIGNDNVGVREDNIFMMVHRMNRKLEGDRRFISF